MDKDNEFEKRSNCEKGTYRTCPKGSSQSANLESGLGKHTWYRFWDLQHHVDTWLPGPLHGAVGIDGPSGEAILSSRGHRILQRPWMVEGRASATLRQKLRGTSPSPKDPKHPNKGYIWFLYQDW